MLRSTSLFFTSATKNNNNNRQPWPSFYSLPPRSSPLNPFSTICVTPVCFILYYSSIVPPPPSLWLCCVIPAKILVSRHIINANYYIIKSTIQQPSFITNLKTSQLSTSIHLAYINHDRLSLSPRCNSSSIQRCIRLLAVVVVISYASANANIAVIRFNICKMPFIEPRRRCINSEGHRRH